MSGSDDRTRRLVEVARELVAELDPESVLERILGAAREVTGARYAALGVLDESRTELERFVTSGIDEATHLAIGDLPRGRGVLGVLIADPRPLRLTDVGSHPQSYGFPLGHPPMATFLGVPIVIRGHAWGNLYLSEKADGAPFSDADEEAVLVLARWAATAIENSRLYAASERRRAEAEQALRSLQAARDIADAIGSAIGLDRVLELVVKRGRALIDARSVLILLREGDALHVAAGAGHAASVRGQRIPVAGSRFGQVLERGVPERISDIGSHLRIAPGELGVPGAHAALLVPMLHLGTGIGVLAAFDRGGEDQGFSAADAELLGAFASSAANAVAIRRGVEAERLRTTIAAADAERARWARELHDETLQALAAVRVLLASAARRNDPDEMTAAVRQAVEDAEAATDHLRSIITDLRPASLENVGLRPALEALLDLHDQESLHIEPRLRLPEPCDGERSLPVELETAVYRVVQEAVANAVRHAHASRLEVTVAVEGDEIVIEVSDDGHGFDTSAETAGFGLAGIRERVYLAGGEVRVVSGAEGTMIRATLPLPAPAPSISESDQVAG